MNEYELKRRHGELRNKDDLGKELLANPDLVWHTSDFISKMSRRCRKCYPIFLKDVNNGVDTTKPEYYERALCDSCRALYKAKLEVLK